MEKDIPCATCHSWNGKHKKFSCKPQDCRQLSDWLKQQAPQFRLDTVEMEVRVPENVIQYVV